MLKWVYFSLLVFLAVIISSNNNKTDLALVLAQAATNNNNNNTLQSTLSSQPSAITHGVKITSPTKGQQVPIGKDITITGTSLANPNSNCQITVIVNHVKPYQPATAAGPGGSKDYSKWNFVLSSKYTTIHQGQNNRITAKYNCSSANPGGLSFNSVNVTGVPAAVTSAATIQLSHQQQQQQQQQSITTENNNSNTATSSEPSGIPGIP
jgi:hypothetical protein